jgi:hypothetical protein
MATAGRDASIWDSYNIDLAPASKTYAANGMSSRQHRNRQGAVFEVKVGRAFRIVDSRQSTVRHEAAYCIRRALRRWELQMLDLIMLAIGLGFFALSVGYTIACDRL